MDHLKKTNPNHVSALKMKKLIDMVELLVQSGKISKSTLEKCMVNAFRERRTLALALGNTKEEERTSSPLDFSTLLYFDCWFISNNIDYPFP
ncbi:Mechanosensitive ion channel family protein [Trifolium repens]|nr:Mechanosensitive ion channel family protein [Trifolium repens]